MSAEVCRLGQKDEKEQRTTRVSSSNVRGSVLDKVKLHGTRGDIWKLLGPFGAAANLWAHVFNAYHFIRNFLHVTASHRQLLGWVYHTHVCTLCAWLPRYPTCTTQPSSSRTW